MTVAPPEVATSGVRVALGGDVRFVTADGTGVREVEARVLSYGVAPDTFGTTWKQGVFDSSIREALDSRTPIPFVWGHDERNINNVIGSVVGYEDRPDGLHLRMRMANFDEVPSARTAHSLMRDGHVSGFSVKFRDGETVPDPNHRNALQFTRAKLVHIAAVIDPSVPGTKTTAVRSSDDPELRAAIDAGVRKALADLLGDERQVTLTIGDDGSITTSGAQPDDGGQDDEPSVPELASAIDGAVDAALGIAAGLDLSALPAEVGQLVQLLHAADVAADELLEVLGLPDPDADEPDDDTIAAEARAVAEEQEQYTYGDGQYYLTERAAKEPYGNVEYADPGYQKDKQKRYPIDTAEHVRAAWDYISKEHNAQVYSAEHLAQIKDRIKAAAKKLGVEISDGQKRSADDDDFARALATLDRLGERR